MKKEQHIRRLRRAWRRRKRSSAVLCVTVLAVLFSAAGCSGAETAAKPTADDLKTGAFRRYYSQKAETDTEHDHSRMDLDVLEGMASSTAGTAVDTEELTIDVAGAIFSGNTAEIILRLTAKKLDSLLHDNGTEALKNYRFGDETAMLGMIALGRQFYAIDHVYTYSDTDDTLAPNQLELHYWIKTPEPLEQGVLSIPLTDFGFYGEGGAEFVPLYKGTWSVDIAVDPAADPGRRISVGKEMTVGEYRFTLESIQLTPLACTVRLVCREDEAFTDAHMDEIIDACSGEEAALALTLTDAAVLDSGQMDIGGRWTREYPLSIAWTLSFCSPMAVESFASLSLYGNAFSLSG